MMTSQPARWRHTFQRLRKSWPMLSHLLPLAIALLIFGTLAWQQFITLDYVPETGFAAKQLDYHDSIGSWYYRLPIAGALGVMGLRGAYFFAVFTIAAYLAFYAMRKLLPAYAGVGFLLLVFNPFVYARIMGGQLGIVVGYLLLPVFLRYLLSYLEFRQRQDWVFATIAAAAAASSHPAFLPLCLLVLGFAWLFVAQDGIGGQFPRTVARRPAPMRTSSRRELLGPMLGMAACILLLCSFWVFHALAGGTAERVAQISQEDLDFFAPKATHGVPVAAKVIGLWGFWREAGYVTTYAGMPALAWYAMVGILFGLLLLGYRTSEDRGSARLFFALWLVGLLFALGVSHPYTRPLFELLFRHLPFFSGFRDSHKFVALMALAYAFLCPQGLRAFARWVRRQVTGRSARNGGVGGFVPGIVTVAAMLIVLLLTYPLLHLWGQVRPLDYPQTYARTDEFLKQQTISGHVLYLPYHDYLTYNWSRGSTPDGRMANPINRLVTPLVITSPGPWGEQTALAKQIGLCLQQEAGTRADCLAQDGVQFVLVDKCFVTPVDYAWLGEPVLHETCVDVYALHAEPRAVPPASRSPLLLGVTVSAIALCGLLWWGWRS